MQSKYIQDLLIRLNIEEAKLASTLDCHGKQLSKVEEATEYRSLMGALQYATITRSDIAFVVNKACPFMSQTTYAH